MVLIGAIPLVRAQASDQSDDRAAIAHLITSTWETPERKILVEPVVVSGDHGLAGWLQGERGGRALLKRNRGTWLVVLCSGDPLKDAANLVVTGVPEPVAAQLTAGLDAAERVLSPEHRAAFSRFEGLVDMRDHHGQHQQHK